MPTAAGRLNAPSRRRARHARRSGRVFRVEFAELIAVEFGRRRTPRTTSIEPHADRVGGDQIIDVARLIERPAPRVRGLRNEYHRGPAALAADQFGDLVDLGSREGYDRGAARQPRQFLLAREVQGREARAAQDIGAGEQLLHHAPHGRGAEHQRFLAAAPVEHAVGEHVAALEIGAQLNLVDRNERHVEIARHRLDGGDPEARVRRLDLLLAGDQRDGVRADPLDALVIDLAREQSQRQPDDTARMRQHALDRQMRLAGVGRPEHGGHAGAARTNVAGRMG